MQRKLVYPALVDYDNVFRCTADKHVVPCGEYLIYAKNQATDMIKEMLFFDGSKKDLNFVASCECGELVGTFYQGTKCKKCGTVVKTNFASDLKFRVWLEIPELVTDVNDPKFIPPILHPGVYAILKRAFASVKRGDPPIIDVLLNPDKKFQDDYFPEEFRKVGICPGYRFFYRNFKDIMEYLMSGKFAPLARPAERKRMEHLPELFDKYSNVLFFRHIPILNQSLSLLTSSGSMTYSDKCVQYISKVVADLSNFLYRYRNGNVTGQYIDQQLYTIYDAYTKYVESVTIVKMIGKTGFIRKLVLGTRLHCTARGVIAPITGEHECDELHIPWRIGVDILKLEILNLLINRYDYTMMEALTKYTKATKVYDAEIDKIMQTLIQECHDFTEVYVPHLGMSIHPKGLPVLCGRNPSIRVGAIMLYFVTKVKSDLADNTINISSRCASAPNFDYDGKLALPHILVRECA